MIQFRRCHRRYSPRTAIRQTKTSSRAQKGGSPHIHTYQLVQHERTVRFDIQERQNYAGGRSGLVGERLLLVGVRKVPRVHVDFDDDIEDNTMRRSQAKRLKADGRWKRRTIRIKPKMVFDPLIKIRIHG